MNARGLFSQWFTTLTDASFPLVSLSFLIENPAERASVWPDIVGRVRSHYLSDETLALYCRELEYDDVASLLEQRLPSHPRSRSGDLGEVLAIEYANEMVGVPIHLKRLRNKDERDTSLRGDDFICVGFDPDKELHVLKGESKSRISLSQEVIDEAEQKLRSNDGHPSEHNCGLIADTLLDSDPELGLALVAYNLKRLSKFTLHHVLFALTQSKPVRLFPKFAAKAYIPNVPRALVAMIVKGHQKMINQVYTDATSPDFLPPKT